MARRAGQRLRRAGQNPRRFGPFARPRLRRSPRACFASGRARPIAPGARARTRRRHIVVTLATLPLLGYISGCFSGWPLAPLSRSGTHEPKETRLQPASPREGRSLPGALFGGGISPLHGDRRPGGVEAVYAEENIWLSQKMTGLLYDVKIRIVNDHLKNAFEDDERQEGSVLRNFRITAADGKTSDTRHYLRWQLTGARSTAEAARRVNAEAFINLASRPSLLGATARTPNPQANRRW